MLMLQYMNMLRYGRAAHCSLLGVRMLFGAVRGAWRCETRLVALRRGSGDGGGESYAPRAPLLPVGIAALVVLPTE